MRMMMLEGMRSNMNNKNMREVVIKVINGMIEGRRGGRGGYFPYSFDLNLNLILMWMGEKKRMIG